MISTLHNMDRSQTQPSRALSKFISIFQPQESIKTLFWSHTDVFNELHFSPEICTFQSNFFIKVVFEGIYTYQKWFFLWYTRFSSKNLQKLKMSHTDVFLKCLKYLKICIFLWVKLILNTSLSSNWSNNGIDGQNIVES